ncbi:MAG: NYN domain-containing protein [Bacteriovoracaceae bacterium]|nr:NYN domain-containing protein [Bacteriovoracaceae bacterium]
MSEKILISQSVAILIDGNNIERSLETEYGADSRMVNFNVLIPRLLGERGLNRLIYFREGQNISSRLADKLHADFYGSVRACHKSADIPLSIKATQLSGKVDTIIILSGDSDYVELVRHLKGEGVRVEICAVENHVAQVLKDEADHFYLMQKTDCFGAHMPQQRPKPKRAPSTGKNRR